MNPLIIHVDDPTNIEALRRALADRPEVQIVDMSARGIVGMPSAAQFALVDAARAGDRIREMISLSPVPDEPPRVYVPGDYAPLRSWNIETSKEEKQSMIALSMAYILSAGVPSIPGERDPFRRPERAPKPPSDVQTATKAKADAKRARRNAKRLANAGMDS